MKASRSEEVNAPKTPVASGGMSNVDALGGMHLYCTSLPQVLRLRISRYIGKLMTLQISYSPREANGRRFPPL